ncbi:MAG: hypothetical protein II889_02890 [Clostridia bacterium]|nr:hypothetical protein [Clostridia bacterium]
MLYYLRETGMPHLLVATKTDKLNATETKEFLDAVAADALTRDLPLVLYSAKTNRGRDELWRKIYETTGI